MEFKGPAASGIPSMMANEPVSLLKQPTPVSKKDNILDGIPTLGGAIGGGGIKQDAKPPANDYLSMLGNNNNR